MESGFKPTSVGYIPVRRPGDPVQGVSGGPGVCMPPVGATNYLQIRGTAMEDTQTDLVCVGGPLDGRRIRVGRGQQSIHAHDDGTRDSAEMILDARVEPSVPIKVVTYERETVHDRTGRNVVEAEFLRLKGEGLGQALRHLVEGYRRSRGPDLITDLTPADLDRMEALALAAGGADACWHASDHAWDSGAVYDSNHHHVVYDEGAPSAEEAQHIAAADPATLLKLIALARKGLANL